MRYALPVSIEGKGIEAFIPRFKVVMAGLYLVPAIFHRGPNIGFGRTPAPPTQPCCRKIPLADHKPRPNMNVAVD